MGHDMERFAAVSGSEYGAWANASRLEFRDARLTTEQAGDIETAFNREFDVEAKRYAENQKRIAAFEEKTKGRENLADPKKGAAFQLSVLLAHYEIAWKAPVTFDCIRVHSTWQGRRQIRPWFTLEWWDGGQYRLIAEVRDNKFETRVFEFPPIKSSRLRLTIWDDRSYTEGWCDSRGFLNPMEVFGN